MNLGSKYLDEVIDLNQFPIVSLVVEHPGIYYSILKSMVLGGGPELVFSEFDTPKDLASVVELVTDPFSLTLADKKMDSLLSKMPISLKPRCSNDIWVAIARPRFPAPTIMALNRKFSPKIEPISSCSCVTL